MVVSGLEVGYSLKVSFLPEKKKKKKLEDTILLIRLIKSPG